MVYVTIVTQHPKNGNYYTYACLSKSVRTGKKVKRVYIKYLGRVDGYEILKNQEIKDLFKKYNYCCAKCKSGEKLTIDHILPKCEGGLNNIENLQILCKSCNNHKADNSPKVVL
jgi:5-methylcytosine-specific restriction endonuclease McrA